MLSWEEIQSEHIKSLMLVEPQSTVEYKVDIISSLLVVAKPEQQSGIFL